MNETAKKQENQSWTSANTLTQEQVKQLVLDKLARAQIQQVTERKLKQIT